MRLHIAAVAGVSLLGAVAVAVPGSAGGNKYDSVSKSFTCKDTTGADAGTVALYGPIKLWPPNHKFIDEPVTVTDLSGDSVSVTITPVVTDAAGGDGGTQHDPDYQLAGSEEGDPIVASGASPQTAAMQLRSERSGKGEGRTYTINWSATFDNGTTKCNSDEEGFDPFVITVPHDMRGGQDWKS